MYRANSVKAVFESSLICRRNDYLNKNLRKINFLLSLICTEKSLFLIDIREKGGAFEGGAH